MNVFAVEALREEFARHADIDCNDLVYQARKYHSRGLSRVHGQRFDLIVFLDKRYERTDAGRRKTATAPTGKGVVTGGARSCLRSGQVVHRRCRAR
jgi:hypothetical protein